jgi:hypothetical protein
MLLSLHFFIFFLSSCCFLFWFFCLSPGCIFIFPFCGINQLTCSRGKPSQSGSLRLIYSFTKRWDLQTELVFAHLTSIGTCTFGRSFVGFPFSIILGVLLSDKTMTVSGSAFLPLSPCPPSLHIPIADNPDLSRHSSFFLFCFLLLWLSHCLSAFADLSLKRAVFAK